MQSLYKQLRARFKFGAYSMIAHAEVLILNYSNSYTHDQFWEACILLHAQVFHVC